MAAAKSNTNWFAIGVSIAVVVVLVAIGGLVVFLNNQATAPGVAPKSDIVDGKTGAISFGSGEYEIDTYVDFMCPICGQFEDAYGEQLQSAAANGTITLSIHPISILDRASQNTQFSTRSANAAYCVAEQAPDSFLAFFNLLFERQPEENSTGLTDKELSAIAEESGAGAAADCISAGTFNKFVADMTALTPPDPETGRVGTPTVVINGDRIQNADIASQFAKLLG